MVIDSHLSSFVEKTTNDVNDNLFLEDKIYSQNQENKANQVVEAEILILEKDNRESCKNQKSNHFLNHF